MSKSEKSSRWEIQGKDTDSKSERWDSQPYSEALLEQHRVFIHSFDKYWLGIMT